jgi:hypothetical protein
MQARSHVAAVFVAVFALGCQHESLLHVRDAEKVSFGHLERVRAPTTSDPSPGRAFDDRGVSNPMLPSLDTFLPYTRDGNWIVGAEGHSIRYEIHRDWLSVYVPIKTGRSTYAIIPVQTRIDNVCHFGLRTRPQQSLALVVGMVGLLGVGWGAAKELAPPQDHSLAPVVLLAVGGTALATALALALWPASAEHVVVDATCSAPTSTLERSAPSRVIIPRFRARAEQDHGLRRTFDDLTRRAGVDGVVIKSLTGHVTEKMRNHYSTVGLDEKLVAVSSVHRLVPLGSGDAGGGANAAQEKAGEG